MRHPVHFIPIATTIFAVIFAAMVYRRYQQKRGLHLLWWAGGILIYGVGTLTEAMTTLLGWQEWIFRAWYISGALMGGAPLAQGTVYLLMKRKTADRLTIALVATIATAAVFAFLTPIRYDLVEPYRLSGKAMEWQWVRLFSPFINIYAFIFLVGGAVYSAYRFKKSPKTHYRYVGNVFIAIGALLPGIGGTATRFGYVEVLYITEFVGLSLIFLGYRIITGRKTGAAVDIETAQVVGKPVA